MNTLRMKSYLRWLFGITFIAFVANKLIVRPYILEHDFPLYLKIMVLSFPNTCEAILGMSCVSVIFMMAKNRCSPQFDHVSERVVVFIATLLSGVYVITQEFNLHRLGGKNTYDPFDVIASVVGLLGMYLVLTRFGILEETENVAV